jgi:predicted DNA-binding WGR domain protein
MSGVLRYFEFVDGSSNKFWEIVADEKTVKTRYGKIGTSGQTTVKEFSSDVEVSKEVARLVSEKTKKGYIEPASKAQPTDLSVAKEPSSSGVNNGELDSRNIELEAKVAANPYDKKAWKALTDWLLKQGDLRGQLAVLQLAKNEEEAAQFLEQHSEYFLGSLAMHTQTYDYEEEEAFLWRNGFIFGAKLSYVSYQKNFESDFFPQDVLRPLLVHPSGRFLTEIGFQDNGEGGNDLQDLIDVLAKYAPKSIRKLELGYNVDQISWYKIGHLGSLWKALPNLQKLDIEAGSFILGKINLPELKHAVFLTGGLSSESGKAIATANWPKLEHLEIYYGHENYGAECSMKEVRPLLKRTDLPNLKYLGLKNCEFTDAICAELTTSPLLKGIRTLDLSLGCMTIKGAKILAANPDAFKHLDEINVEDNYLDKEAVEILKGLCKKVTGLRSQKQEDEPDYRYVSVGE